MRCDVDDDDGGDGDDDSDVIVCMMMMIEIRNDLLLKHDKHDDDKNRFLTKQKLFKRGFLN